MQIALINDVLDFARLESGSVQVEPRPMRVADAVARAETLLRLQMSEAGLQFTTSGCDGDLTAVADPDRLQQILLNLLTNAIKFTPRGGGIAVSCERREDRVRIDVRDTGIGIPPDDLPRIFSPFVQLGAAGAPSRGVGLGLAISRDLARAMNGEVSAISTPGEGSTFTIELPAA
jgi:signal transduction histidine kinase